MRRKAPPKHRRAIVAEEGFERPHVSDCETNDLQHSPNSFGTESGTLQDETGTVDPDLAVVVHAWPDLPESARTDILAMVKAAGAITGEDR